MRSEESGRKLTLRLAFSIPKHEGYCNEDSYQCSCRRGIYAVSDGASISYDSASWSKILVRRYARLPEISQSWLNDAIAEFTKLHDRDSMPWMKQAAFDKGSFASLLGVRYFIESHRVQVFAVGDSVAVLCDGDTIVSSWPYADAAQFDQSPRLLCTNPGENALIEEAALSDDHFADWSLADWDAPALFCMTDALGHWLLSNRHEVPSPIARLRAIRTPKQFAQFVNAERIAGRMRRDDTTLLGLW